jgi:signal transduction histidine kinase
MVAACRLVAHRTEDRTWLIVRRAGIDFGRYCRGGEVRTLDLMDRPARRHIPTAVVVISVVAVAAQVALVMVGELLSDPRPAVAALVGDVVIGVLCCALVPWLLRAPLVPAGLMSVLAAVSPAATPAVAVATLHTARVRPWRDALTVAAAACVAHLVRGVWRPIQGLAFVWWTIVVVAVAIALVAWGALSQARAAIVASLKERARRAEEDQEQRVHQARADERARLAWEMHDVLAHRLTIVATYAGALAYRPDAPPERVAEAADIVRSGVQLALQELRDVVRFLRDGEETSVRLTPQPDLADLPALVAETRLNGTPVDLHCSVDVDADVPAQIARTVYRVVQEGLTNVRKHAAGAPTRVEVTRSGGSMIVTVTNDDRAAQPDPAIAESGGGIGLIGLRERVELLGGQLRHGPTQGQYRLEASIPWPG